VRFEVAGSPSLDVCDPVGDLEKFIPRLSQIRMRAMDEDVELSFELTEADRGASVLLATLSELECRLDRRQDDDGYRERSRREGQSSARTSVRLL
jgi:hypothetical protein